MLHLTGESGVLVSGLLMMSLSPPPPSCSFSLSSSQQFFLVPAAGEDGSKENLFLTMDMEVEHDVLSGGVGEKHSGRQKSGSNHSLPKESSVLCFVRAAEGREGGEKSISSPIRNLEVCLIQDQPSSAPGLHPLLHPNFHSLRFSRTHSQNAG